MPSLKPASEIDLSDGCWMYEYRYSGTAPSDERCDFTVSAHFDAGSERFFSGLRIVLICKGGKRLENLTVAEKPEAEAALIENGGPSPPEDVPMQDADKPLCPVVFELVAEGHMTWTSTGVYLRSPQLLEDDTYRIVHEHTLLCPQSRAAMLFLKANRSIRGCLSAFAIRLQEHHHRLLRTGYAGPAGIVARGACILPPPSLRAPFKQPPPEILLLIFSAVTAINEKDLMDGRDPWRESLFACARVCRAWTQPALDALYADFFAYQTGSGGGGPDQVELAAALRLNPARGRAIRRFATRHFTPRDGEDDHEALSQALVCILSAAVLVQDVTVEDVRAPDKDGLVEALCGCAAVRTFALDKGAPWVQRDSIRLSLDDVIRCVAHWPQLRALTMENYGRSAQQTASASDGGESGITCKLNELSLDHGRASYTQLRRLTASSLSSLTQVSLVDIVGLTNADVTEWLLAMAPNLVRLRLKRCEFPKHRPDEELAVDVAVMEMDNIENLALEGGLFTESVFRLKRRTTRSGATRRLYLRRIRPGAFTTRLLSLLESTGWGKVEVGNVPDGDEELFKSAKRIARERGISFL
ncbi:hypothetical protein EVG20_g5148 [Dentipellis fragilis]|uniref:F-box domain-containing protein n=1 Tax=Dentipellis fragilis TaxID=205917 RepID=A0A4Y9YW40_9AGAM|nr:hypothetical protein EVG20_g5148 [Dentipellis fragilis]